MPISTTHNSFTYRKGCVISTTQTIHWTRPEMARAYANMIANTCYHSEHVTITVFDHAENL